jgi:hypothetical protein
MFLAKGVAQPGAAFFILKSGDSSASSRHFGFGYFRRCIVMVSYVGSRIVKGHNT